jgi:hypothetical protein
MKAIFFTLIACLLITGISNAQDRVPLKYVNHTEFGGLFGRVIYPTASVFTGEMADNRLNVTVQTFNGVMLNQRLMAGITIGVDWYKTAVLNPISAGIRYDFAKKDNVSLFGTADVGHAFSWFQDDLDGFETKGGFMVNPGLGLRIGKPGQAAVTFTMTYKRQEAYITKVPLWNQLERSEDRVYNRLALRLGVSF